MKKSVFLIVSVVLLRVFAISAQWTPQQTEWYYPEPEKVTPGVQAGAPPSDAIVLFDGKDLSKWVNSKGEKAEWTVADGVLSVKPGRGIFDQRALWDCHCILNFDARLRIPSRISNMVSC